MRSKIKTILILGLVVIVIPFLGIPLAWKQWILAIIGLAIMILAFVLRQALSRAPQMRQEVYTENRPETGSSDSTQDKQS